MTDKELLELAAKAIGLDLCWNDAEAPGYYSEWRGMPQWEYWNPMVSDGCALRLAVKLRINIEHMQTMGGKDFGINCWPVGRGDCGATEEDLADYFAATRRAIVRAAAEIGRSI